MSEQTEALGLFANLLSLPAEKQRQREEARMNRAALLQSGMSAAEVDHIIPDPGEDVGAFGSAIGTVGSGLRSILGDPVPAPRMDERVLGYAKWKQGQRTGEDFTGDVKNWMIRAQVDPEAGTTPLERMRWAQERAQEAAIARAAAMAGVRGAETSATQGRKEQRDIDEGDTLFEENQLVPRRRARPTPVEPEAEYRPGIRRVAASSATEPPPSEALSPGGTPLIPKAATEQRGNRTIQFTTQYEQLTPYEQRAVDQLAPDGNIDLGDKDKRAQIATVARYLQQQDAAATLPLTRERVEQRAAGIPLVGDIPQEEATRGLEDIRGRQLEHHARELRMDRESKMLEQAQKFAVARLPEVTGISRTVLPLMDEASQALTDSRVAAKSGKQRFDLWMQATAGDRGAFIARQLLAQRARLARLYDVGNASETEQKVWDGLLNFSEMTYQEAQLAVRVLGRILAVERKNIKTMMTAKNTHDLGRLLRSSGPRGGIILTPKADTIEADEAEETLRRKGLL